MTLQERINQVQEHVNNCTGTIEEATEILVRFKSLYEEIKQTYDDTYKIYHQADYILYTALCWLVSDYALIAESESYFELGWFASYGAGFIPNKVTGTMTENKDS